MCLMIIAIIINIIIIVFVVNIIIIIVIIIVIIIIIIIIIIQEVDWKDTTIFKHIYIRLCCSDTSWIKVKVCNYLARDWSVP